MEGCLRLTRRGGWGGRRRGGCGLLGDGERDGDGIALWEDLASADGTPGGVEVIHCGGRGVCGCVWRRGRDGRRECGRERKRGRTTGWVFIDGWPTGPPAAEGATGSGPNEQAPPILSRSCFVPARPMFCLASDPPIAPNFPAATRLVRHSALDPPSSPPGQLRLTFPRLKAQLSRLGSPSISLSSPGPAPATFQPRSITPAATHATDPPALPSDYITYPSPPVLHIS